MTDIETTADDIRLANYARVEGANAKKALKIAKLCVQWKNACNRGEKLEAGKYMGELNDLVNCYISSCMVGASRSCDTQAHYINSIAVDKVHYEALYDVERLAHIETSLENALLRKQLEAARNGQGLREATAMIEVLEKETETAQTEINNLKKELKESREVVSSLVYRIQDLKSKNQEYRDELTVYIQKSVDKSDTIVELKWQLQQQNN